MAKPEDYDYDIFISYKRDTPVEKWVEELLYPELIKWLPDEFPPNSTPKVFLDKIICPGQRWSPAISKAHKYSKILIPVLNSPYFGSNWCIAELEAMINREQVLGLNPDEHASGLIYPLIFGDGKFFPPYIQKVKHKNMKKYASVAEAFKSSKDFLGFETEIKRVVIDLANMMAGVPAFDSNWPVITLKEEPAHPATFMEAPKFIKETVI